MRNGANCCGVMQIVVPLHSQTERFVAIYIKDNKCYNRCSKVKRLLMIFLMFKVGKERK